MSTVTLLIVIVVVVVVVAAIAVAVLAMQRKRRSDRLREEFGPEYERTMRSSDDPREAEADLRRREKQRAKIELRELDQRERDQYRERWDSVQREFVDDPGRAVEQADRLVVDVMSARGYPAQDVDRRADDLSVDFPVITQRYREAREISRTHEQGRADTEDLRGAVTSYRALVHALLDDTDDRDAGADRSRTTSRDDRALDAGRDGRVAEHPRDGGQDRTPDRDGHVGRERAVDRDLDRDRDRAVDRDRDLDRDRAANGDRAATRDGDGGRDGYQDDRDRRRDGDPDGARDRHPDDDLDRGLRRDRNLDRDRDRDLNRNGDRDLNRDRDGDRDLDRDRVRDGDRGRGPDGRHDDGPDGDRDGRRLRDVVRDRITGDGGHDRDGGRENRPAADGDRRGRAGAPDVEPWERGRHSTRGRTDDDPRRGATT